MKLPKNCVAAERIQGLVKEQIAKHEPLEEAGNGIRPSGLVTVAFMTGISEKTIGLMSRGQQKWWGVDNLDKFLTKLDLEYLTREPPENGGFADIFDNLQPVQPRKYFYPKRPAPKKKCACGNEMNKKSTICRECDLKRRSESKPRCTDCKKPLHSARRTEKPRCWDCWMIEKKRRKTPESAQRWKDKASTTRRGYGVS